MPKLPAHLRPLEGLTVRFPPEDMAWIRTQALAGPCTFNDIIRALVRDCRTSFGLPPAVVARLDAVRGNRSLREYVIDLLLQSYAAEGEPAARPPPRSRRTGAS